ncbi:MAG TPA: hypothetical protein VH105_23115 [Burkholderiales bacterium]|jgi:hypothetical protein|nr:hypothetical protein [Burkholderiales bacterium]
MRISIMVSPESPNYSIVLSDDNAFIHYRSLASARNPAEMAERLRAAVALGQANRLKRIMFDSRGAPFQAGIGAQYDYAYNQAWKLGLTRDWRIALLVSPGDASYGFMETAFINSGYIARLFDGYAPAADWLRGHTSAPA